MVEGAPAVVTFYDGGAAKEAGVETGDVVVSVDGKSVEERTAELEPYISASTPQSLGGKIADLLLKGPDGSKAEVVFRGRGGQEKRVHLARSRSFYSQGTSWRGGEILRILPGNIGYADLERLNGSMVEGMFEKFRDCKAIILDMRGYPQGTAWQIAPRLTAIKNVAAALFERPVLLAPGGASGQFLWQQTAHSFMQRIPESDQPVFPGKTVMLIDERAISQSEHSGLFFRAANGTEFIGSPTTGANGDVTYFLVPGGIRVGMTGHNVRWPDGRQLQRVGLIPDVYVEPTLEGLRQGRDEVLERAIEHLSQ
jgi:C-terminal processing protease CtpA/Prc